MNKFLLRAVVIIGNIFIQAVIIFVVDNPDEETNGNLNEIIDFIKILNKSQQGIIINNSVVKQKNLNLIDVAGLSSADVSCV